MFRGGYATRVFLSKSAEVIENKGRESEKEAQERKRVRKRMQGKGLELEWRERYARSVRDNVERILVRRWFAAARRRFSSLWPQAG